MTVTVHWDNELHTMLRFDVAGQWSWLELRRQLRIGFAMTRTVDHSIYVIISLMGQTRFPPDPIANITSITPFLPPNWRGLVIVNAHEESDMLSALTERYEREGVRLMLATSLDEARTLIQHAVRSESSRPG